MKLYESRLNKIESNHSCAIDKFRALSSPIDIRRRYLSMETGHYFRRDFTAELCHKNRKSAIIASVLLIEPWDQ